MITRRQFVSGAATALAGPALALHAGHDPALFRPARSQLTDIPHETARLQRVYDSPAPKAKNPGR